MLANIRRYGPRCQRPVPCRSDPTHGRITHRPPAEAVAEPPPLSSVHGGPPRPRLAACLKARPVPFSFSADSDIIRPVNLFIASKEVHRVRYAFGSDEA